MSKKALSEYKDASCLNCIREKVCSIKPSSPVPAVSFYDILYHWPAEHRRKGGDETWEMGNAFAKKTQPPKRVIEKEFYHQVARCCKDWQDDNRCWTEVDRVYETRWDCCTVPEEVRRSA